MNCFPKRSSDGLPCPGNRICTVSLLLAISSGFQSLLRMRALHGNPRMFRRGHCQVSCRPRHSLSLTAAALPAAKFEVLSYARNRELAEVCIKTLASALATDPSSGHYLVPGRAQQFFEAATRLVMRLFPYSPQLISVDNGACAAICFAIPRLEPVNWWGLLSPDLVTALSCVRLDKLKDAMTAADFYDERRDQFVESQRGTVLYLLGIGTKPEYQCRGLGSTALAALCDLADRQQVALYLEATSQRSTRLYARHGFLTLSTGSSSPGAPETTFMWRPPTGQDDDTSTQPRGAEAAALGEGGTVGAAGDADVGSASSLSRGVFSRYAGKTDAARDRSSVQ